MVGVLVLFVARAAHAGIEPTALLGWSARRWTKVDGLPMDEVRALDLDPDGLAWIATLDGLVRFDGHEFQVHTPSRHPALPSSRFVDVQVGPEGTVWAITEGGALAHGGAARFDALPLEPLGLGAAHDLVETSRGSWIVGDLGLARIDGAKAIAVPLAGQAPFSSPLRLLHEDEAGVHWLVEATGTVHRLDLVAGARVVVGKLPAPEPIALGSLRGPTLPSTFRPAAGDLWTAGPEEVTRRAADGTQTRFSTAPGPRLHPRAGGGVSVFAGGAFLEPVDGRLAPLDAPPPVPLGTWWTDGRRLHRGGEVALEADGELTLLRVGDDGSAWVAERGRGLLHVRRGPATAIQRDALGEMGVVNPVLVDSRGGLWIGAEAALRRHLDGLAQPVLDDAGNPVAGARALLELREGGVLVTTANSGCRVESLPASGPLRCGAAGLDELGGDVTVATQTSDGAVWLGGPELRRRATDGRIETVVAAGGRHTSFRTVVETSDGVVFAAAQGRGLFRIEDGRVEHRSDALGSPLRAVRAVHLDERGDAWLGTEGHGVCRLALSLGPSFAEAPLRCFGEQEGLADGFVSSFASDGRGRVWMSSNRGLQGARWADLVDLVEGRLEEVQVVHVGRGEGMVEPETNGVTRPSVARGAGGVLWYPTMAGVARLDPDAAVVGEPPPVVLESVSSPQRALSPAEGAIVLGPEERELRARWTAAEFAHAENLRFRYRLVGLDEAWRGPSDERSATWTALPPGSYRLRVQSGWAGRWHPTGLDLPVEVPPTFRETRLYATSLVLLVVALVATVVVARLRAARASARQLEEAVVAATTELAARNRRLVQQAGELTEQRLVLARQAGDLEDRNARIASQSDALMERNARVAAQAERLAQIDQARTRFVANISHELRTPLTLVRGALDDIAEGLPERARAQVRTAERNAERLAQLVEQLLDVAKVDAGGVQLHARRTDLGSFLARVCERFADAARARGVDLRLTLPADIEVWLDPDLMEKVVTNLVSNGLDHCRPGGWLAVELREVGDADVGRVEVRVTDSGPGVPEELRERIFDRFFQVEDGDRRRRGGAGIGLSLAREFVALHGGALDVENRPGAGASFRVSLPLGSTHLSIEEISLAPPPPGVTRVAAPPPRAPEEADATSLPVALVVEDHPDMRAYVAEHLGEAFQVVTAVDGQDAVERLQGGLRPAVVVSDVMMPRLDGLALCRALRSDTRWASVPVLLLSAKATDEDRVAGLSLADAYLTKPFRAADMVSSARRLAEHGRGALPVERPAGEFVESDPWTDPDTPVARSAPSAFLERLERIAREHLSDSDFGAAELARKSGTSPRQLLRKVQEETGMTAAAWLREQRLREAQARLRSGEVDTVSEAAAAVGLNPAYLSRVYLAWAGRRPSDDLGRL